MFALTDKDLGETNTVEHSIDTEDAPPVFTCLRRIPYALRENLERATYKPYSDQDIRIEKSNSPYASALALVCKKGGGFCMC